MGTALGFEVSQVKALQKDESDEQGQNEIEDGGGFVANDPVRMIARNGRVLNPGESATYPLNNYRFKVVKPSAEGEIIG